MSYRVVWDEFALIELDEACFDILDNSSKNAQKVKSDIVNETKKLSLMPKKHRYDRLRSDGNVAFRAFELHRLRVSYFINEEKKWIIIIRVRHTSREPLFH